MRECPKCGNLVDPAYFVSQGTMNVCEDCAMELMNPSRACDPWAVKLAKGSFKTKAEGVEALVGDEKLLYGLVVEKGSVYGPEAPQLLGISDARVKKAFSVLRHMELLKGRRRPDGTADLVEF